MSSITLPAPSAARPALMPTRSRVCLVAAPEVLDAASRAAEHLRDEGQDTVVMSTADMGSFQQVDVVLVFAGLQAAATARSATPEHVEVRVELLEGVQANWTTVIARAARTAAASVPARPSGPSDVTEDEA